MRKEEFFEALAKVTLEERAGDISYAEIDYRWFADGGSEGPAITYFTSDGSDAGRPKSYDRIAKTFRAQGRELREAQGAESGTLPNRVRLRIGSDGSWHGGFEYDPTIDIEDEKQSRRVLGDEGYEYYKRKDAEARAQTANAHVPDPVQAESSSALWTSAAELLGFIHTELVKDLPGDWQTLDVEGEVWFENGQRSVRTLYHYTTPKGRQRFTATNTFGPMNAVIRLHDQFRPEGKPWRKIMLQFKRDSSSTMVDTQ